MCVMLTVSMISDADDVGSGFSYQGELLDNGSPANGDYDIVFKAYDAPENGAIGITVPEILDVPVSNGLFFIESVDFGDVQFTGEAIWLEVNVRKSSEGGNYTPLIPRQRIMATPYAVQAQYATDASFAGTALSADTATHATSADTADHALTAGLAENLTANNANPGDILSFNGADWEPIPVGFISQSPWTVNASEIFYTGGNVGIGTGSPSAKFHVNSSADFELTRFQGGDKMYNAYYENNSYRGYVGSYQDGSNPGTRTEDFEIGTANTNSLGAFHLSTKAIPRLTVEPDGEVGINTTNALARFHVEGDVNEDPLRVRIDGSTKLWVKADGNTHVINDLVVNDNVTIEEDLNVQGNTKQDLDNDGMVKYMIRVRCNQEDSFIVSEYNATNTPGTASIATSPYECKITFPFQVNDRYWVVQLNNPFAAVTASCGTTNNNAQLECGAWNTLTDTSEHNVSLNILVY
jgi:hypothetical protein